ncbi:MAG: ECF-type sigma factor [Planctomycetota bacterium]
MTSDDLLKDNGGEGHLEAVYDELRRRAHDAMRKLPPGQTIQPTALVHEAFANLVTRESGPWQDESHFLAVATLAIKAAIVDRIRAKKRIKRGGERQRVPFEEDIPIQMPSVPDETVLKVDELLEQLRAEDARSADVVVYRFFMGMTDKQCAEVLGISERTVRREWTFARTWLASRLGPRTSIDP